MDKNAKLRPFYIAKILYERTDEEHLLSTTDIEKILYEEYGMETYRKTVKSDIEILQQFGFDIETVRSSQNQYHLLTRRFSLPELKLLASAVESSKFITKKKSQELTQKLGCLASKYQAEILKRNIDVEGRIKSENEKIYYIVDAINDAINQRKKISFLYFKYDENKEKRLKNESEPYIFSPYKLIWNGDYYYMIGYSDKHSGIGMFRVDRILNAPELLNEGAVPTPLDFDVNHYLNTMFRMYDGERTTVELVCDNSVIDSIIDKFGENIDIQGKTRETSIVTVELVISHIFFSWVFGFEGKVYIKSPKKIKEQYVDMLKHALEN